MDMLIDAIIYNHYVKAREICRQHGIEFVCNLHEQASAIAAESYAKVSGNLGVALVTSGPGGTNAITGTLAAWLDSTPCLFISGQVKRADLKGGTGLRQLGVQEVDIVSMVRSVTKYAVTLTEPADVRCQLEKCVHFATTGRKGPVWIDIPLDVQAAQIDDSALLPYLPDLESQAGKQPSELRGQVAEVIRVLVPARRPILFAGNGIRLARAENEFADLVDVLGIPVMTSWLAQDLIADAHPLCMGRPGSIAPRGANFAMQNADFLLAIGARLGTATVGYSRANFARAARKIIVDIDAAELKKHESHADLLIHADAGDFIRTLAAEIRSTTNWNGAEWLSRCLEWKKKYPVVQPKHRMRDTPLSTYNFCDVLSDVLAEGDIIAPGSSGFACEIFFLVHRTKRNQRILHARGLGAMGFGPPSAIGACLASGRHRTVCIDGDGGFQMNAQELATIARLELPIKLFVLSNFGYASIRASQTKYFSARIGADPTSGLTLPDLRALSQAYGVKAACIQSSENLRARINEVLDLPGPVVCDVHVLPDEFREPTLSSIQLPDGSMASRPLEDLWPFLEREEFRKNMMIPVLED